MRRSDPTLCATQVGPSITYARDSVLDVAVQDKSKYMGRADTYTSDGYKASGGSTRGRGRSRHYATGLAHHPLPPARHSSSLSSPARLLQARCPTVSPPVWRALVNLKALPPPAPCGGGINPTALPAPSPGPCELSSTPRPSLWRASTRRVCMNIPDCLGPTSMQSSAVWQNGRTVYMNVPW